MIRMALIGCGGMAELHTRRFHTLGDRVRLTAAVDIETAQAQAVAERVGTARVLNDYRDALDLADAVLISLPHHLHHPVGMDCLAAGKHVLMEKPLANSEAECLDLIRAAEQAGRVLMVAYCMRYHPLTIHLKDLVDAQECGETFQLSIWTEQLTRYPPDHWAARAATLGGGQLFSHGCHYIDLLLWFLGRPLEGTHLGTNFGTPWMEREGTSSVSLLFESGALGYHFGTWGARGTRLGYAFHAHGTDGLLEADFYKGQLIRHRRGEETVLLQVDLNSKYTENELAHFLDCIETGQRPLTDGPGSLQGLRVIWRLYEAEQRKVVADLRGLGLDEAVG
jgi:predicted dehydrogenase